MSARVFRGGANATKTEQRATSRFSFKEAITPSSHGRFPHWADTTWPDWLAIGVYTGKHVFEREEKKKERGVRAPPEMSFLCSACESDSRRFVDPLFRTGQTRRTVTHRSPFKGENDILRGEVCAIIDIKVLLGRPFLIQECISLSRGVPAIKSNRRAV